MRRSLSLAIGHYTPDKLDYRIINLMMLGVENNVISKRLGTPLSTVQRRMRILQRSGYIRQIVRPNYKKLGLKKGLLHVYLRTGNIKKVAKDLLLNGGIMSSGIHIGNSDVVGEFVYEDSRQLVDLISKVREMDDIEKVLWSEEVYLLAGKKGSMTSVMKRLMDRKQTNKTKRPLKSRTEEDIFTQSQVTGLATWSYDIGAVFEGQSNELTV